MNAPSRKASLFQNTEYSAQDDEALTAVPSCSPISFPSIGEMLTLAPLSDLHLPGGNDAVARILANRNFMERVHHVVLLGDMVLSYGTPAEYSQVEKFIAALPKPYSAICGNHEFFFQNKPGVWDEASHEEKARNLQRFQKFYGLQTLHYDQHDERGSFIFLCLNDVAHWKQEVLTDESWRFLENSLKQQPQRAAYVFCHAPLMLKNRLDLVYYEAERTACVEAPLSTQQVMAERPAPVFWISGHVHIHPKHYLHPPYEIGAGVWQIHCPDTLGYSRWHRDQHVPERHPHTFSRLLEIRARSMNLVTHDHNKQQDIARFEFNF